jgi:hypothetical protein
MSDQSPGPGWWLASDGRWYPPPPTEPAPATEAPPQQAVSVPLANAVEPAGGPPGPKWWRRKLWRLPVWAWAAIVVVVIAGAAGSSGGDKTTDSATEAIAASTTLPPAEPGASTTAPVTSKATATTSTVAATSSSSSTTTSTSTTTTTKPPIAPVSYQGRGAAVLDVKLDAGQLVMDATHAGRSNFIVKPIAPDGKSGSSLINEIGNYGGRILIADPTKVVALEIKADGAWTFTFDGVGALRVAKVGETYVSEGDDVLLVEPASKGLTRAAFTATDSNFIVRPYNAQGRSLSSIVNEIAPWQGTVVVPAESRLLQVTATGRWTMALTAS